MRGRGGARPLARGGNAASDLLVCFPSRAHLSLMPKPLCSPARPAETARRHLSKTSSRGQASPLFRAQSKSSEAEIAEPTSPKVTCAGQIKIKSKPGNSKNWQSVMEEIERLHSKERKASNWIQALGFKKDLMHFMTCLRSFRFRVGCFGSFPAVVVDSESSVDEEEEEGESGEIHQNQGITGESGDSRTIFSKWLTILQENQQNQLNKEEEDDDGGGSCSEGSVPPKNALLLMRCRSAPARGWLEENHEEEEEKKGAKLALEEETKDTENFILQSYASDFFKVSTDIVKETWVGRSDPFSRSRSWKR